MMNVGEPKISLFTWSVRSRFLVSKLYPKRQQKHLTMFVLLGRALVLLLLLVWFSSFFFSSKRPGAQAQAPLKAGDSSVPVFPAESLEGCFVRDSSSSTSSPSSPSSSLECRSLTVSRVSGEAKLVSVRTGEVLWSSPPQMPRCHY